VMRKMLAKSVVALVRMADQLGVSHPSEVYQGLSATHPGVMGIRKLAG